ncbi:MAG: transglycosylase SLT domain-containing protein [Alphaproteobacteria bacterium]|uniref:Transglycosylase SLT domain-containing protein n=1 Tax=Candidatus Nitrobium versatile TaxID=2884831 RepID=A0A953LXX4_9BACT|nr:transglycosylase SLT domain-containing protein [Candidatus Nitrobium versatile]
MRQLLSTTLLLFLLVGLPLHVRAAEELHAIREKASTSKFYERALEFFTKKIPEAFERKLHSSQEYIELILEIFKEKGIPEDIAYLPFIESGFSPLSIGSGNAVGLWQMVKGTARQYGLRVDQYVDERKDPVKSTHAAANYLNDLYRMFGAWDIALAAYNAGDGKIRRLFSRDQDKSSVRLPEIINRYLAKLMAVSTVAKDPESFGIKPPESGGAEEREYREITTNRIISLAAIAEKYNTTVREIKGLNPALLTNRTPPYRYVIRLPN